MNPGGQCRANLTDRVDVFVCGGIFAIEAFVQDNLTNFKLQGIDLKYTFVRLCTPVVIRKNALFRSIADCSPMYTILQKIKCSRSIESTLK